jgi:hypothetical protein
MGRDEIAACSAPQAPADLASSAQWFEMAGEFHGIIALFSTLT